MFQRKSAFLGTFFFLCQFITTFSLNFTINPYLSQINLTNSTLKSLDDSRTFLNNSLFLYPVSNSILTSNNSLILSNNFTIIGENLNVSLVFSNGFFISVQNRSNALFSNLKIIQNPSHYAEHFFILDSATTITFYNCLLLEINFNENLVAFVFTDNATVFIENTSVLKIVRSLKCLFWLQNSSNFQIYNSSISNLTLSGSLISLLDSNISALEFKVENSILSQISSSDKGVLHLGPNSYFAKCYFNNLTLFQTILINFGENPSVFRLMNVSFTFIFHNSSSEIKPLILSANNSILEAQIIFCLFSNNIAFSNLIFFRKNKGILNFNNSIFLGNYARDAIYCIQSLGIELYDSSFKNQNNKTLPFLQGMFTVPPVSGSCLHIENVYIKYFYNFTIQESSSLTDSFGVKIIDTFDQISSLKSLFNISNDVNITVIFSTFANNYLYYQGNLANIGGAFYFNTIFDVYFENSLFSFNYLNCSSKALNRIGGAAITFFAGKSLTVNNCFFKNNSARFKSSGIFFSGNTLTIYNCAFYNHSPIIDLETYNNYLDIQAKFNLLSILSFIDDSKGGVLYSSGILTTIIGSYFEGNEATYGGSVYVDDSGFDPFNMVCINSSTFNNEHVGFYGAAIYFSTGINSLMGNVTNSIVMNCLAEMGAIFTDTLPMVSDFLLENICFYNNTAEYGGGIMFHQIAGTFILRNSQFYENKVIEIVVKPVGGGCFNIFGDFRNILYASGNIYKNNYADRCGSAFSILGGVLYAKNETYINSLVKMKGGVGIIYSGAFITINDSFVFNSTSLISGGSFSVGDVASLSLNNVTIEESFSPLLGGVFEIIENSILLVSNSKIKTANSDSGGVLDIMDSPLVVSFFENCTFENTTAADAIFSMVNGNVNLINCTFQDQFSNFFTVEQISIVLLSKCAIENSSNAKDNYIKVIEGSILKFYDVIVKNSQADKEKNIFINIQNSELEIKNTIFWNTTYKKSRGLIIGESSSITLKDSAFLNFFTSCFSLNNAQFSLSTSFFYNDDDFIMQTQTYFSIGSIIEITTSVSTNITNCLFHNFTSLSNGTGVKLSNSQDSTIFIASCIFIELTSLQNGGGINVLFSNVQISGSYFIYNSAILFGGAINSENAFQIKTSAFYSNNAKLGGGAIFWSFEKPILQYLDYQNNTAIYGPDIASSLIRIAVQIFDVASILLYNSDISSSVENIIQNQQSGGNFQYTVKLIYLDWYNQTVYSLDNVVETIDIIDLEDRNQLLFSTKRKKQSRTFLFGPNNFPLLDGNLIVNGIKIISDPNSTVYMKFESSIFDFRAFNLRIPKPNLEFIVSNSYFILIPIQVRPCIVGEIFKSLENVCYNCDIQSYSYNSSDVKCSACPSNARCDGGDRMIINDGYWRISNTSSNIYSCQDNADNCEGGLVTICGNNFQGPLCRACIQGYYRIDSNSCIECQGMVWNYLRIAGFIIILFVLVIFLIKSSLDNNQLIIRLKQQTQNNEAVSAKMIMKNVDLQSLYMKIIVNYLQILTLLNDIPVAISIPNFLTSFFGFLNYFSSLSTKFIGFECIFNSKSLESVKPYTRVICVNISALVLILLSILFWHILRNLKRYEEILDKIIMTCIGIYLMLQPNILSEFAKVLICIEIEGKMLLKDEPIYDCQGSFYDGMKTFFFWPAFCFWAFFIPFFVLGILIWNKKKLYELSFYRKMNFFYSGYKEEYYYWDILIFLRKSIVIALSIIAQNSLLKLIIGLVVIAVYFNYQITKKPFYTSDLNFLEFSSNLFIIFTIYFCIVLWKIDNIIVQFLILIVIFILNLAYLCIWLAYYVKYMRKIYKPLALKVFSLLASKAKLVSAKISSSTRNMNPKILKIPEVSLKSTMVSPFEKNKNLRVIIHD